MTTIVIAQVLMFQLVCFGAVRINPNDDVTLRGSTNYNASDPFGLFVKNSNDVSYIEFTLGSLPVTEAAAREVLSLPIFPELTARQQETVVAAIDQFMRQSARSAA